MNPRLYLQEEYESVRRALDESLRHDYGPGDARAYYQECTDRLDFIGGLMSAEADATGTSSLLRQVMDVAKRISLIERSQLGEFSWPFAETIRQLAERLVPERMLDGEETPPIIHMIAEGTGYHIYNERMPDAGANRRLAIVAFPRQLKHHVLMHAIFGHELGHTAFYTNKAGADFTRKVLPALRNGSRLQDAASVRTWFEADDAPDAVRRELAAQPNEYQFPTRTIKNWMLELVCDIFGLLVFGPPFVAAHRVLLEPSCRTPFEVDFAKSTHPPFAVRRRTLATAMRIMGLDVPSTDPAEEAVHGAEKALIAYLVEDDFGPWAEVFEEDALRDAIEAMKAAVGEAAEVFAERPDGIRTTRLVKRLARHLPPILEMIDEEGVSTTEPMAAPDCLYAGWTYWFGREALSTEPLSFLHTNRLCDHALLQQSAINAVARTNAA